MKKTLRVRFWIDVDGKKFFGPGPAELLQLVSETGSVAKAAKVMGMSYKKAWMMVTQLNTKATKPLVISHKGGKKGGGAELTVSGRKVLAAYSRTARQIQSIVKKNADILKLI